LSLAGFPLGELFLIEKEKNNDEFAGIQVGVE
jgi:hypothetical protein